MLKQLEPAKDHLKYICGRSDDRQKPPPFEFIAYIMFTKSALPSQKSMLNKFKYKTVRLMSSITVLNISFSTVFWIKNANLGKLLINIIVVSRKRVLKWFKTLLEIYFYNLSTGYKYYLCIYCVFSLCVFDCMQRWADRSTSYS